MTGRRWVVATRRVFCGGGTCVSGVIEPGEPMQFRYVEGLPRPFVRCERCAGPTDWSQIHATDQPAPRPASDFHGLRDLAPRFDARQAAAGKDDE